MENAKNVIDSQIIELDEANVALSSRDEVRDFMQSSDSRTRDIPLIVCTAGDFDEKNIEELNNEMRIICSLS